MDGEYHVFYQHYPNATKPTTKLHWGHAVTTDLIHWDELPIALYPDKLGQIFSGGAVVDYRNTSGLQTGNIPPIIAIFTQAIDASTFQQQSIAVSNDRGRTFEMYSGNPVIPNDDVNVPDMRDPKVFSMNDKWILSLAVTDKIAFYSSTNLKDWTELSEFGAKPLQGSHGGVWECPDLLLYTLNGQKLWVLLVSINPGGPNLGTVTQYFVGTFDGKVFRKTGISKELWMDWGPDNYAGVTFSNEPKNRKLLIAWMSNWDYGQLLPTEAWRGQLTLPRVLELQKIDGKIRLASIPAEELKLLRNSSQTYETTQPLTVRNVYDFTNELPFNNSLLEVDIVVDTRLVASDRDATFQICFYNALDEQVCVGYTYETNEFYLDRSKSGNAMFHSEFPIRAKAKRETTMEVIQMKIYLDVSSIEVFADGGFTTMTGLFFPTELLYGLQISFDSKIAINKLNVLSVTVRGLKSIYKC